MNTTQISLKYTNGIFIGDTELRKEVNPSIVASVEASMLQLGFIPSKDLHEAMLFLYSKDIARLFKNMIPELERMKGADVEYKPMYPNFPQQVMEASEAELLINALVHYWSFGTLMPVYEKLPRGIFDEDVKYKEVGLTSEEDFNKVVVQLLGSRDSISETDKKTIEWFLKNRPEAFENVGEIPFKENLCYYAGLLFTQGKTDYFKNAVKTATDVLRVATFLSGGDISLAENTKFKSLPREVRRTLVGALHNVIREEDIARHKGKWVRLFHNLHVGDYSERVFDIASKVRNNERLETFNGMVEMAITQGDVNRAVQLLKKRPGDFARRLEHLIRLNKSKAVFVVDSFISVADKVPTRILFQVRGSLKNRMADTDKRIVFPKGNVQKAQVIPGHVKKMNHALIKKLKVRIDHILQLRVEPLEPLGKVWIDPDLRQCPLPTQQRSASEGMFQVARGTRLPIGDKGTLRFFIYWVGQDIDLSATLHDEEFRYKEHISYTKLRSMKYNAYHSGDITYAPDGASEFIDIDIDSAVATGARYVAMNVLVYSGPSFAEHKKVYAGWMTREDVKSGEIYEPTTVEQKVDLTATSRNCIPVIFDLVERKAIWTDLSTKKNTNWGGNNIESNFATIQETMQAITSLNKSTLYELFKIHTLARGEVVEEKEEADVIFSPYREDMPAGATIITPYDIATINSEYVV